MPKNNLNDLLDNKPRIKKPKGLTLSTDVGGETESTSTSEQESTNALVQKDTSTQMPESTNVLEHKDTGAQVQESTSAQMPQNTSAFVQENISASVKDPRPSKGYKIRTDIADACKLLAVQRKRKMYEVMEEGLLLYLRQQGVDIS